MRAMLGPAHADRRQLRDLVTAELSPRPPLLAGERATAPATPLGVVIDDLVNLILGPQLTPCALVPALPASLALLALPRINSFAFARASARRCARVFGGSKEGGLEVVRESWRACASNRLNRSSNASTRAARSTMNWTHASRPAS